MYCWGKAQEGALGVGGIEDLRVITPKWNNYIGHQNVKSIGKYCIIQITFCSRSPTTHTT